MAMATDHNSSSAFSAVSSITSSVGRAFSANFGKLGERQLIILDVEHILNSDEQEQLRQHAA